MSLPNDLVPLPTMPYDERPSELPLDIQECRTALWRCRGNISNAAELLKTSSNRLRNFVKKSPYLSEEAKESQERLVDIAEDVVYDALTDKEDTARQDTMARFVLSGLGKARGHGAGNTGLTLNLPKGPMTISWGDGSQITGNDNSPASSGPVIEGSVNK